MRARSTELGATLPDKLSVVTSHTNTLHLAALKAGLAWGMCGHNESNKYNTQYLHTWHKYDSHFHPVTFTKSTARGEKSQACIKRAVFSSSSGNTVFPTPHPTSRRTG